MARTKVTPEQFEIQASGVRHIPTGARFTADPGKSDLTHANWGRTGDVLRNGEDYRRDDVLGGAKQVWSQRNKP